jgi:TonB family protein
MLLPIHIIPVMMKSTVVCMGIGAMLCGIGAAQSAKVGMPDSIVIARHTFFDIGPPFDFYEVIRVKEQGDGLAIERALVTPLGPACGPLASVEMSSGTLHESISDLLGGKNPCTIPEKGLHRELKRCKHCLTFSGVNVTMQVSCGGTLRQLRMDILDRDLFDSAPHTPENTSWTMRMLGRLDKVLGPGVWDKPMFAIGDAKAEPVPDTELVQGIRDAKYDALFGKGQLVSQIAIDAKKAPPPPPSVEIESVVPVAPVSPKIPIYPPIAKAARVEGAVNVTFDISPEGKVVNIAVVDGPKLLQLSVTDGLSGWSFPPSAWGSSGRASIRFRRNCSAGPS